MALRINHNVPALNALRNLNKTDDALSSSLEKLSSGQRINRAADGPATLVISEQMRGQIASISQAIQNSEASISMIQTAEAALNEVNTLMVSMRQLAIHAANEGANDEKMLAADQFEIENALDTVDRIARTSQFGTRTLLDGSNGANGVAVGDGMNFVEASPDTESSPADGYAVNVTRVSTRAVRVGNRPITISDLRPTDPQALSKSFQIMIAEGGKNIAFSMENNEDGDVIRKLLAEMDRNPGQFNNTLVESNIRQTIAENLQRKALDNGLEVEVFLEDPDRTGLGKLAVRHNKFGSGNTFFVASTVPDVLAVQTNRFEEAVPGRDVEGTIDGKIAVGHGEELHGAESTEVGGLVVRFDSVQNTKQRIAKFVANGPEIVPNPQLRDNPNGIPPVQGARLLGKEEDGEYAIFNWEIPADVSRDIDGYVHVTQNSLAFQVGPTRGQQVRLSLIDAKSDRLSRGVDNDTGFESLREINVTTPQGAQDALLLIDDAITEISTLRASLGAFQKNTLQSNANSLRVAHENLTSAESSLRDADMAEEVSHFTRNQIMLSSGMAMLAQANQTPKSVLQLLGGGQG